MILEIVVGLEGSKLISNRISKEFQHKGKIGNCFVICVVHCIFTFAKEETVPLKSIDCRFGPDAFFYPNRL